MEDCLAWSGRRPVEWLLDQAAVDARWCLVHAIHKTAAETRALAVSGAVAGLCPITEATLDDGIFAGRAFLGPADVSAWAATRMSRFPRRRSCGSSNTASGLRRAPATCWPTRPGVRPAAASMKTPLRAVGRRSGDASARLRRGRRADLVVLDPDHPDLQAKPCDHWLDAYVFVAGRVLVDTVFVGDRRVVSEGRHHARDRVRTCYTGTTARLAAE